MEDVGDVEARHIRSCSSSESVARSKRIVNEFQRKNNTPTVRLRRPITKITAADQRSPLVRISAAQETMKSPKRELFIPDQYLSMWCPE